MGNSARMQNPDLWTKIDLSPTCDKVGCLGILVVTYNQGCLFRPFSAPWPLFFVGRSPVGPGPFQPRDCLIRLEVANKLWVRVTKTFQKGHKELPGSWRFFPPVASALEMLRLAASSSSPKFAGRLGKIPKKSGPKNHRNPPRKVSSLGAFGKNSAGKPVKLHPPPKSERLELKLRLNTCNPQTIGAFLMSVPFQQHGGFESSFLHGSF